MIECFIYWCRVPRNLLLLMVCGELHAPNFFLTVLHNVVVLGNDFNVIACWQPGSLLIH